MKIENNKDLRNLNTMHLISRAKYFVVLKDIQQLPLIFDFINSNNLPYFVLGGGSNMILPLEYNGLVIYNQLLGIEKIDINNDTVLVKAMAGVGWDDFVAYTIDNGWFGLENLSLIPGTVGAAPIQNIGAYGAEAKDFIEYVEVYNVQDKSFITLQNKECEFVYRNSILKNNSNYIVNAVIFRLLLNAKLNMAYGDIAKQMATVKSPNAQNLRNCVIKTRQSKLPDPKVIGNVGSFFHNPILPNEQIEVLKQQYPMLPVFSYDAMHSKVSAGWLIDNLGLKGFRQGNVGVYEKQALVLVNHGSADQIETLAFAKLIQDKVYKNYNIKLNIEPIIVT